MAKQVRKELQDNYWTYQIAKQLKTSKPFKQVTANKYRVRFTHKSERLELYKNIDYISLYSIHDLKLLKEWDITNFSITQLVMYLDQR